MEIETDETYHSRTALVKPPHKCPLVKPLLPEEYKKKKELHDPLS